MDYARYSAGSRIAQDRVRGASPGDLPAVRRNPLTTADASANSERYAHMPSTGASCLFDASGAGDEDRPRSPGAASDGASVIPSVPAHIRRSTSPCVTCMSVESTTAARSGKSAGSASGGHHDSKSRAMTPAGSRARSPTRDAAVLGEAQIPQTDRLGDGPPDETRGPPRPRAAACVPLAVSRASTPMRNRSISRAGVLMAEVSGTSAAARAAARDRASGRRGTARRRSRAASPGRSPAGAPFASPTISESDC